MLTEFNYHTDKRLSLQIINSAGNDVINAGFDMDKVPTTNPANQDTEQPSGFVLNINLNNIELRSEGLYRIIIRLDDSDIGQFYFRVKKKG